MKKIYLGDAVYAELEPGGVVVTTEDGIRVTNRVYMEAGVILAFCGFLATVSPAFADRMTKEIREKGEQRVASRGED